jgi:hypothetical protein
LVEKEDDLKTRAATDEDYIRCPKCRNSLKVFVDKNPEGAKSDLAIAKMLMMTEAEIKKIYQNAVSKLRTLIVDKQK